MIIIKRKNLRNLFCLLLVVLALYLLDNTRLSKYIGYEKVQENIKKEINVFGIAEGFFGNKMFLFYNTDTSVSNTIISEEESGNGYIVFVEENYLYSTFLGTVTSIKKEGKFYSVVISKVSGNVLYSNLNSVCVKLYEKIEVDTLIGSIDGFYYYEQI